MARATAWVFCVLLALPALAGCTFPDLNPPSRWNLDVPLGLIVSPTAGNALEDVAPAAELAARQVQASELGATIRLRQDAATDNVNAAFDRLADAGVAAVVAAVAPQEAAALAQQAASKRVPLILVTPARPAPSPHEDLLQLAVPPDAAGAALADRAGVSNVTIFQVSDVFTDMVVEGFTAELDGAVVARVNLTRGAQGAAITAARAACAEGAGAALILAPAIEAGWVVRGLQEGGCRERMRIVVGPLARSTDFVTEAGRDDERRPYAAGAVGVEPAGSRHSEFRTFFATEYDREPGAFAAATYDAVIVATLAAFEAKASPGARPVRADITSADLRPHLLAVADSPGVKHREMASAIAAAKEGDEIDWVGYSHDFDFTDARAPQPGAYQTWRVTPTGGIERAAG